MNNKPISSTALYPNTNESNNSTPDIKIGTFKTFKISIVKTYRTFIKKFKNNNVLKFSSSKINQRHVTNILYNQDDNFANSTDIQREVNEARLNDANEYDANEYDANEYDTSVNNKESIYDDVVTPSIKEKTHFVPDFTQESQSTSNDNDYLNTDKTFIGENDEEIYENIAQNEEIYANVTYDTIKLAADRNFIKQAQQKTQPLVRYLQNYQSYSTNEADPKTDDVFKDISKNSPKFDDKNTIACANKFRDIKCPKNNSATKGNIYHANNIDMPEGKYIAAQGPTTKLVKTIDGNHQIINISKNFISMLAETDSPLSVSLVSEDEFNSRKSKNDKLPPNEIGESIEIPEFTSDNGVVNKAVTITKLNSIYDSNIKIQIDFLEINGKKHVRIYDLRWPDKTGGDPQRLSAISLLVENLRMLPELANRKAAPLVVNCNAGVGRTGTFININNMMRDHLKGGNATNEQHLINNITTARKSRPRFVQTNTQLQTLIQIAESPDAIFKPIITAFNNNN